MSNIIHVTSPITGAGNRLDLELVVPLLEENGFNVSKYGVGGRGKITRSGELARTLMRSPTGFKLNIFMGPIFPEWILVSAKNVWIPNPEGVSDAVRRYLPKIDMVLAKTRLTERIFRDLGKPTQYIGFTTHDIDLPDIQRDYTRYFHACSSPYKGTKRLLEVWKAHPEWPELVCVISNEDEEAAKITASNIQTIFRNVPQEEFRLLQNQIGFHICCSEAEGFGHYLYEALSCGAVVLTTNGPPMNEFTQGTPGLLLDCEEETPVVGLSNRYFFTPASLEKQVRRTMVMDAEELKNFRKSGREYFLANDRQFRSTFPEVIRSLMT